ncbi:MAG: T9SS type A sorting domain-containing protein [Bacteroidetes bacterium]|nr:T9SS type A sorting domain-containing protein [Bacteroidota bacterium]
MNIARVSLLASFLYCFGLYGQAGQLDTSFGIGGMAFLDMDTSYFSVVDMAIQNDGKILVTGRINSGQGWDIYLVRCLPDGAPDQSFGNQGIVQTDIGTFWDEGRAIAVQPDGKIIVAAQSQVDIFGVLKLARYLPDGTLDATFATGGMASTPPPSYGSPYDIALNAEGDILVAGSSGDLSEIAVFRFTANGIPDSTFHADGIFNLSIAFGFNWAPRIMVQQDGSLLMAVVFGQSGAYDVGLVKLQSNGDLDLAFGDQGIATLSVSPGDEMIGGLGVQSDGSIIIAGQTDYYLNYDMFAARFTPGGILDASFGSNGVSRISISIGQDGARDLVIQPDDAILLTGYSGLNMTSMPVTVVRLSPNGQLDPGYGSSGIVLTGIPSMPSAQGVCVAMQPDGRLIVAAGGGHHPVLLRYLTWDPTGISVHDQAGDLISVFPNPASSMITIQFPQGSTSMVTWELVDAMGRIVASNKHHFQGSAEVSGDQLNIGQLAPGGYLVLFYANGRRGAVKLMKE